ncbi:MAG: hypothetical protein ACLTYN_05690 [Dysosmobacter welbionis]
MFAALNLDANDASISPLIVMAWAVISFFCGRYGRERATLLVQLPVVPVGALIGLLAVLLLPDIARIRADAVGRDRAQDQEIATLKARLAVLESGSGTCWHPVESPPAAPPSFPPGQMRSSPVPAATAARGQSAFLLRLWPAVSI